MRAGRRAGWWSAARWAAEFFRRADRSSDDLEWALRTRHPAVIDHTLRQHARTVRELWSFVRGLVGEVYRLNPVGPHVPLEFLERLFARARDRAERDGALAARMGRAGGKRARGMARTARLSAAEARRIARLLRAQAERAGLRSRKAARHGPMALTDGGRAWTR